MKENLDRLITLNLKNEIENSGMTKSEIAKALGITPPTVSQYCSGRSQPTLSTLSKLCMLLDCSADDILCVTKFEINGQ